MRRVSMQARARRERRAISPRLGPRVIALVALTLGLLLFVSNIFAMIAIDGIGEYDAFWLTSSSRAPPLFATFAFCALLLAHAVAADLLMAWRGRERLGAGTRFAYGANVALALAVFAFLARMQDWPAWLWHPIDERFPYQADWWTQEHVALVRDRLPPTGDEPTRFVIESLPGRGPTQRITARADSELPLHPGLPVLVYRGSPGYRQPVQDTVIGYVTADDFHYRAGSLERLAHLLWIFDLNPALVPLTERLTIATARLPIRELDSIVRACQLAAQVAQAGDGYGSIDLTWILPDGTRFACPSIELGRWHDREDAIILHSTREP